MPESVMATTLRISDAAIADLRERLARTRFPDQAPGPAWSYGPISNTRTSLSSIGAMASTGGRRRLGSTLSRNTRPSCST
jgi:hypothetical protein